MVIFAGVVFAETDVQVVSEAVGSVDITLQRDSSTGAATFSVHLLTLQQFSERNVSNVDTCQLQLADLRLTSDLSTGDHAQARLGE